MYLKILTDLLVLSTPKQGHVVCVRRFWHIYRIHLVIVTDVHVFRPRGQERVGFTMPSLCMYVQYMRMHGLMCASLGPERFIGFYLYSVFVSFVNMIVLAPKIGTLQTKLKNKVLIL
jgi:hypothetical protein